MIEDYGKFGSGPGSFEAVAQFELGESFTRWESWAHNDYLEFYLTFGKPGVAILIAITVVLVFQFFVSYFASSAMVLGCFSLFAVAGVASHAIFDFPLQVYSILVPICVLLQYPQIGRIKP